MGAEEVGGGATSDAKRQEVVVLVAERLQPAFFFGRASRALGLSPTFGRRAPNFREISRALGRAELFYKLSRKSDPGLDTIWETPAITFWEVE